MWCWLPLLLGVLMTVGGGFLIVRFFAGDGKQRPEVAHVRRTQSMFVGALLTSLGPLLLILGILGVISDGVFIC